MSGNEFTCEECRKEFDTEKQVTAHVEAEHLEEMSSMK
jgi:hypothetical protein